MRKIILCVVCVIVLVGCGAPRARPNTSGGSGSDMTKGDAQALCFPGWTDGQFKDHLATVAEYMRNDNFFLIGDEARDRVKCDKNLAFSYYWTIYKSVSAKLDHAPISEKAAGDQFLSGWG